MGAGSLKSVPSQARTEAQTEEIEDNAAMDAAVKAKKELVPLAENVANMFRPELVKLRDSLVSRALKRLPPEARQDKRAEFERYINIEQLLSLYTQTLVAYFTKEELKALRTFMADDSGRQVLEKLPDVMSSMRLKRQRYLQETLGEILRKEVLEKAEKGEPSLLAP